MQQCEECKGTKLEVWDFHPEVTKSGQQIKMVVCQDCGKPQPKK